MPYPYSDNLYSADLEDTEPTEDQLIEDAYGLGQQRREWRDPLQSFGEQGEEEGEGSSGQRATSGGSQEYSNDHSNYLLSPSDGYFHAAPDAAWQPLTSSSNNVPHIPNVWVTDPSLQQGSSAESKAREAERERPDRLGATNRESNPSAASGQAPVRAYHPSTSSSTRAPQGLAPFSSSSSSSSSTGGSSSFSPGSTTRYQPSSSAYVPWSPTGPYTSRIPRRDVDERSSLFSAEAPPAYTPSPTNPSTNPSTSSGSSDAARNYQSISTTTIVSTNASMGRWPEEVPSAQGRLVHAPQSMADSAAPRDEFRRDIPHGWREHVRQRVRRVKWWSCRKTVFALILFFVVTCSLGRITQMIKNEGPFIPGKDPARKPPTNNNPSMDYPDLDDGFFHWKSGYFCRDVSIHQPSQQFNLSFGLGNALSISQIVTDERGPANGREVRVSGDVVFRRAGTGTGTPSPSIVVDVIVSDSNIPVKTVFGSQSAPQDLLVSVPRKLAWHETSTWPCVNIRVTVWVPEGASLDGLAVDTVHLDIKLMDNLSLKIAEQQTTLQSIVGAITAASDGTITGDSDRYGDGDIYRLLNNGAPDSFRFDSRHIEVRTQSADIRGAWPLYDYLGLQATSGHVVATIDPQPAAPSAPPSKPVILYARTSSGDVDLREPVVSGTALSQFDSSTIAPRDYRVQVQTTSGKIGGALAFGSSARFRSVSGDVAVQLLPVLDISLAVAEGGGGGALQAELDTGTTSGDTTVTVLEPLWVNLGTGRLAAFPRRRDERDDLIDEVDEEAEEEEEVYIRSNSTALRCLRSKHTTTSADLQLVYPASWEGGMDLSSVTGDLQARGEGVRVTRSGDDWGINHRLWAVKGEGDGSGGSSIVVRTTSGAVDVFVESP